MGSRYIPCTVQNEYLQGSGVVIGAAGSHDDVYLRLTFGAMWDGLTKYVTFRDALGQNPTLVTILPSMAVEGMANTYDVTTPSTAKAKQGRMMVVVTGYTVVNGVQEDTATMTTTAYFRVLPSDFTLLDDGSIDATLAQQLQAQITDIEEDILDARAAAKDSEAWAVGQIEGVDVGDTDPRYHNNSKYYSQQAASSASAAAGSASDAAGYKSDAQSAKNDAVSAKNSAQGAASDANADKLAAAASATAAEKWATGETGGTPSSTNNAKYYSEEAADSATAASNSASSASDEATEAKSYAKGGTSSRTGEDTDNAKYYKEQAGSFAASASGSATTAVSRATEAKSYARGGTDTRTGEDTDNAKYYKEQAAGSASSASSSATAADGSAKDAEAWAVGKRGGTDVGDTDPTYHNNAKYWAEIAEQAAGGGVTSFNGRTGVVVPLAGDYTKDMVGLGNVPNVATNDQEPTYEAAANVTALSSGEKLSVAFGKIAKAISRLITHLADTDNPHSVTAAQAGAVAEDANSSVAFTMGVDSGGLYMVTPDE